MLMTMHRIDPNVSPDDCLKILNAAYHENLGMPSKLSADLEVTCLVNKLRNIFGLSDAVFYDTDDNFFPDYARILEELESKIPDTGLRISSLVGKSVDEIIAKASTSNDASEMMAYRYALQALNPFAITGLDYSPRNQDGELDLYNRLTGKGEITESWLADRAAMLERLMVENSRVIDIPFSGDNNRYIDLATGIVLEDNLEPGTDSVIQFGGAGNDLLGSFTGDAGDSSRLYGGAGDDDLLDSLGDDYLEGGTGFDRYFVGAGQDTILDA
ncbi:MAG: hypothetical protein LBJ59_06960, partial [Zoogloeaceae bacterium]|nr:hypothetical protein [Zoogloeaceae bacterium]